MQLLGIVGSLRTGSINRRVMEAIRAMLPEGVTLEVADIGNLPLFNQDHEKMNYPAEAQALKDKIRTADGIIIVTPEYNRSIPGVLKNAIDWTSRPYGDSAWDGKKVLVTGASGGNISTALAQYHLKQILLYLNTRLMGQPEVMLGHVGEGGLDEKGKEFLSKAVVGFVEFVQKG